MKLCWRPSQLSLLFLRLEGVEHTWHGAPCNVPSDGTASHLIWWSVPVNLTWSCTSDQVNVIINIYLSSAFALWKYQKCYFQRMKITSNCDVTSCTACGMPHLEDLKNPKNVITENSMFWLNIEIISLVRQDVVTFSLVLRFRESIKNLVSLVK